jgi:ATP-binding cassette subfamily B protein
MYRALLLLRGRKWLVLILILCNILSVVLTFVEPIFYKNVIDGLIALERSTGFSTLFPFLMLWGAIGIIAIVVRLFINLATDRMAHRYFNVAVKECFSYILELPLEFHSSTHSGKLAKIIQRGTDAIFRVQLDFFRRILTEILTLILTIPLVLSLHWKMGLIVIVVGALIACIAIFSVMKTGKKQEEIEHYYTELSHEYSDTFSNISIIKSFTLRDFAFSKIDALLKARIDAQFPILKWWAFLTSFSQITRVILSVFVISLGAYFYSLHEMTIGEIVMFLSIALIFLQSIE